MPYPAKAVANCFLSLAGDDDVSPMKMQKLVYFAHGWLLAVDNDPLINEQIEAWKYGPVVPSLFRCLKHYGNSPIDRPIVITKVTRDSETGKLIMRRSTPSLKDYEDEGVNIATAVIERTWHEYGKYSAVRLSNMTHEQGGPWDRVMNDCDRQPPHGTDIPRKYIEEHFKQSLQRNLKTTAEGQPRHPTGRTEMVRCSWPS